MNITHMSVPGEDGMKITPTCSVSAVTTWSRSSAPPCSCGNYIKGCEDGCRHVKNI